MQTSAFSAEERTRLERKAREFDAIAQTVFAPIYPVIASRLLEIAGVRSGRCLDVGCGGGQLGLAAASLFAGEVVLLDSNPYMTAIAASRIARGESGRVRSVHGDVHSMPFGDSVFDLVISRGAMWFWDKAESVREIWRVLAAGGSAVIGGGYGTSAMKADIYRKLSRLNGEDFTVSRKKFTESAGPEDYVPALRRLGVPHFRCVHDESGDWLHFQKPCVAVFASEGA